MAEKTIKRCEWCLSHPIMTVYHDVEWGVPVHDDRKLFEFLVLDAAQAGLSWLTILKKRENYRRAFHKFDAERVAKYKEKEIERLLADEGIIRNRLKIHSAVENAKGLLAVQKEFGSFDRFIWQFVDGKPVRNKFKAMANIPASTELSDAMSKDLKARGFRFVGSTICYSFMQAAGLVNDHVTGCYRYKEV